MKAIFTDNDAFRAFSTEHKIVLLLTALLTVFCPLVTNYSLALDEQQMLLRGIAVIVSLAVAGWTLARMFLGRFDFTTDLPLDICNLAGILLPFLMWDPHPTIYQVLYFWVMAGTLQAILTPNLYNAFPHYTSLKYWTAHCGLIIYFVTLTATTELQPTLAGVLISFIVLLIYAALMYGINVLLGSNYFYVIRKPDTASVLDYLGDWPWYILAGAIFALIVFYLLYLPFSF